MSGKIDIFPLSTENHIAESIQKQKLDISEVLSWVASVTIMSSMNATDPVNMASIIYWNMVAGDDLTPKRKTIVSK